VTPDLQRSAEPFTPDLTFREIDGGHWVVRHNPALIAHHVRTHAAQREG
jgi:hypothetical protein